MSPCSKNLKLELFIPTYPHSPYPLLSLFSQAPLPKPGRIFIAFLCDRKLP